MVIHQIIASPVAARASSASGANQLGIALYHIGTTQLAGLGHELPGMIQKLPKPPSIRAFDFLSFALAVMGADRFTLRKSSEDAWTRVIDLQVDVVEPDPWNQQAEALSAMLRFLTGDIWHLKFCPNGEGPPIFPTTQTNRDCACLFSGGLDSLIGSVNLLTDERNPFLVSQASPKEGNIQAQLANIINSNIQRFEGKTSERYKPPYEPSSRARSILFIAYGVLVANTLSGAVNESVDLFIPENGFIAINPPLTRRRIGSLSTRTTHPYFLKSLQKILIQVGLSVNLINPYGHQTKGEMLARCHNHNLYQYADKSYSCGKGKRLNQNCGRCVPCLIRRAAFYKAEILDNTNYRAMDLAKHANYDDIFAVRSCIAQLKTRNVAKWASEAGPLPENATEQARLIDVVRRGATELEDFMNTVKWP